MKIERFFEAGYAVVPSVLTRAQVDAALRLINASVGRGMDKSDMPSFESRSFCPELQKHPDIFGLFRASPALGIVRGLAGRSVWSHDRAQIALRFPVAGAEAARLAPHIDGFYTPENGLTAGTLSPFMGIVGFFLSDVDQDWAGNFTVWPGTHRLFERHFREQPPRPDMKDGIPPVALPEPVQLKVKAGDMVIAHYQCAHAAAPNLSAHVRYAVFVRFDCDARVRRGNAVYGDIWADWEGIRT